MKRIKIVVALLTVVFATACEKEELTHVNPNLNKFQVDCKDCPDTWDLTDTVP